MPGTIGVFSEEAKIKSPLQEVENVQIYQRACWKVGVEDAFTVSDLRKPGGTGVGVVINNICSLCRTAVSLGTWKGAALGPIPTKENTTRKWTPVETVPNYKHTDDVAESPFEQAVTRMNLELLELTQECSRLTAVKLNLMEERRGTKEVQDMERQKLTTRIAEAEAKNSKLLAPADAPAAPSGNEADWKRASVELGAASKQADAARLAREAAEEEANRVAARVASLADEKARLEEQLRARKEMQSEDKRPQEEKKIVVKAVQNATGFYYTAAKGTDPEKLAALQDKIRDLMLSRAVDFSVVAMLASEFKNEAGRRVLGVCLKMLLKQKKRVELTNDSFELVLYLLNTSLVAMDLAKASDFITGRIILSASHKIFRKSDSRGDDYVFNYIREHPLWQSLDFWEENFWTSEVRRVRKTGANVGIVQAAMSTVYNAFTWSMPHPSDTRALLGRILQKESNETIEAAWQRLLQLIPANLPPSPRAPARPPPSRPGPQVASAKSERDKMLDEL